MIVQTDAKILVGGDFTEINGSSCNHIARLNPDGSLEDFNPGSNDIVKTLVVQTDNKIVVGG